MANLANFFTPSTETIRGVSDRTGMNLPDLPYGGILSLLTGGVPTFVADNVMKYTIPKIAEAFSPEVSEGLDNANQQNSNMTQGYRDAVLDRVFGTAPPVDMTGAYSGIFDNPQASWGGVSYSPDSMQNYGLNVDQYDAPAFDIAQYFGNQNTPAFDIPEFNLSDIGMDFEQMPEFNSFDFQDSLPSFDYTDFDFRKGGKV